MSEPTTEALTPLTIGKSAGFLVADVCSCGGRESRRTWRAIGDLRNRHRSDCPAVAVLSRLPAIESEARATAPAGLDRERLAEALHLASPETHFRRRCHERHDIRAANIAAEYDRLAASGETEQDRS